MRVHIKVTHTYMLTLRGHGEEAVRRLEHFLLQDLAEMADLLDVTVTFETPTGTFSYELTAPVAPLIAQVAEQLAAFDLYESTASTGQE